MSNTSWEVREVPVVSNFVLCLECAAVVFKLFKMNTLIMGHFIPRGKWVLSQSGLPCRSENRRLHP